MLGRYVGATLVVLGGAMLVAPKADQPEGAEAPAQESGLENVVARAATPPAGLDANEARAPDAEKSDDILSSLAEHEDMVRARLDQPPAPPLARPEGPARSDLAGLGPAAPVPTLSQPETVGAARVTPETLALVERAEEAHSPGPSSGQVGASDSRVYVSGSRVNVRTGPSTQYGVITSLPYGQPVELLAENGDGWARIRLDGGREGFMARRFLADDLGDG